MSKSPVERKNPSESIKGPEEDKTIAKTQINLSTLQQMLGLRLMTEEKEKNAMGKIEKFEHMSSSMINSPTNFKNSKEQIKDILAIIPEEIRPLTKRMLDRFIIGQLVKQGVIPYIGSDQKVHLDFMKKADGEFKRTWTPASSNANFLITPDMLKDYMAYESPGQNPAQAMSVIQARRDKNTPLSQKNILQITDIPASQKSLALSYISNGSSIPIDGEIIDRAAADVSELQKANIPDSVRAIGDQVTQFEQLAKKGKFPSTPEGIGNMLQHPIRETTERFGVGAGFLVVVGIAILAKNLGKKLAGKDAKFFGKSIGFLSVLAGIGIVGNLGGAMVKDGGRDTIDTGKPERETKKLRDRFSNMPQEFDDAFVAFDRLSQSFPDKAEKKFHEYAKAEDLFNKGGGPFKSTPDAIDRLTTKDLTIDGHEATKDGLDAYKSLYRILYTRYRKIVDDRARVPGREEEVFPAARLNLAEKSLQTFLGDFYTVSPTEASDIAKKEEKFAIKTDQKTKLGLINDSNNSTAIKRITDSFPVSSGAMTTLIDPTIGLFRPYSSPVAEVQTGPNKLLLPIWQRDKPLNYEFSYEVTTYSYSSLLPIRTGGDKYRVKITDASSTPPKVAYAILGTDDRRAAGTTTSPKKYHVTHLVIDSVLYTR